MKRHSFVPFSQALIRMASVVLGMGLLTSIAQADTPAGQVITQPVGVGQAYYSVPSHAEAWFDVGGYCKVVDVGDLSLLPRNAQGQVASSIPVFDPGSATQWENWRTVTPTHYQGQLTSTTCCRLQAKIATLCTRDGATPVSVSRQYGKLGETDTVTATCTGANGPYQDSVSLTCSGDNGPDGQAIWSESGPDNPTCTTAPTTTYGACSTAGVGGSGYQLATVTNCLGQVLSQSYSGPSCYTAPPCTPSYSYACDGSSYVRTNDTCGTGSAVVGTCTLQQGSTVVSCGDPNTPDGPYEYSPGCETTFYDCGNSWPAVPSYYNCTPNACVPENPSPSHSGTCGASSGDPCGVESYTCTYYYYAPP